MIDGFFSCRERKAEMEIVIGSSPIHPESFLPFPFDPGSGVSFFWTPEA